LECVVVARADLAIQFWEGRFVDGQARNVCRLGSSSQCERAAAGVPDEPDRLGDAVGEGHNVVDKALGLLVGVLGAQPTTRRLMG
jgi:hypothetical protein